MEVWASCLSLQFVSLQSVLVADRGELPLLTVTLETAVISNATFPNDPRNPNAEHQCSVFPKLPECRNDDLSVGVSTDHVFNSEEK